MQVRTTRSGSGSSRGSGATLNSYKPGVEIQSTTIGQYAEIELIPVTTDSYVVIGIHLLHRLLTFIL